MTPPPNRPDERDELTDAEHHELARALDTSHGETLAVIESFEESARPVDLETPIGRLSRMDAIQQKHMSAASLEQARLRLRQIEAALKAIELGTYGFCRKCEEPIGSRRLRARPETPFCLDCQGQSESVR